MYPWIHEKYLWILRELKIRNSVNLMTWFVALSLYSLVPAPLFSRPPTTRTIFLMAYVTIQQRLFSNMNKTLCERFYSFGANNSVSFCFLMAKMWTFGFLLPRIRAIPFATFDGCHVAEFYYFISRPRAFDCFAEDRSLNLPAKVQKLLLLLIPPLKYNP